MHPGDGDAISVRELSIRYGEVLAVDRLSFSCARGEIVALLGPNGAGKTSTVETLEGYRTPTAGSVRVLGLDPVRDHRALTERIGVMLQTGGVYTGMRPLEALRLFASYYRDPADPAELLDRVGLHDVKGTTWRHLSGGEQQRLSLALALVGRPEVAFLDEPTAGIDPSGKQVIRDVVADLRTQGATVLLTTHDLDEAERLADRVLIIDRGRLLASGTPDELRGADGHEEIRFAAPAGIDMSSLRTVLDGASIVEATPGQYVASVAPDPATIAAITGWLAERDIALGDLRAGRQHLEDVFLRLTRDARADEAPAPAVASRRSRRRNEQPKAGR